MKIKKIPMRMCCVTKERFPKQELIRVVKTPDGEIVIDESGKVNGHGAYIKKDLSVLEKAKKSKTLDRTLECEITEEKYSELESVISK